MSAAHNHFSDSDKSWQAVSKKNTCPVCNGDHNCKESLDGSAIWCGRKESHRQNAGGQWLWFRDGAGYIPAGMLSHKSVGYRAVPVAVVVDVSIDNHREKSAAAKYESASSDPALLKPFAIDMSVPLAGFTRMKIKTTLHNGKPALIIPEKITNDGHEAGFSIRYLSDDCPAGKSTKDFMAGTRRGLTRWGAGPVVHAVEGASDAIVLAGCKITVISRPNNMMGGDMLGRLVGHEESLIVWAENDQKPDGRWPGLEGAKKVAQKAANESMKPVRVVCPPSQYKDIRDWWRDYCRHRSADPTKPSNADVAYFQQMISDHITENAYSIGVDSERRCDCLCRAQARESSRKIDALYSGSCGVRRMFARACDDGGYDAVGLKLRCKRSNSCESCARVREADFLCNLFNVWLRDNLATIYRYCVDEDRAQQVLERIRYAEGEYAWFRRGDGKRIIWTNVEIQSLGGKTYDVAGCIDELSADCRGSDRSSSARRMQVSKGWQWHEDEEETADMVMLGPYNRDALAEVASEYGYKLQTIETPSNADYREVDEVRMSESINTVRGLYVDALDRADPSRVFERTEITFLTSPINRKPNTGDVRNSTPLFDSLSPDDIE